MTTYLNQPLYDQLKSLFGTVKVSNKGDRAHLHYKGKKGVVVSHGEYYRVKCPMCGGARFTLWVNYLFGTHDERTNSKLNHIAKCYRCDRYGLEIPPLQQIIKPSFAKAVAHVPTGNTEEVRITPAPLPEGDYSLLEELPLTHPARAYLESRGYDTTELSREWRWMYCSSSNRRMVDKRVFIPVFFEIEMGKATELVGYQARAVPGLSPLQEPKYYTMKNFPKSHVLYNLDQARKHDVVVITEGVTDAVRVGSCAVSLLGKSMSQGQEQNIRERCRGADIAVLLDSDAYQSAHKLVYRLNQGVMRGINKAFVVPLPQGDPGDYTREQLKVMIDQARG